MVALAELGMAGQSRAWDVRNGWYHETTPLQLVAPNLPDAAEYETQRERNHSIEGRRHCETRRIPSFGRPRLSLAAKGLPNRFLGLGTLKASPLRGYLLWLAMRTFVLIEGDQSWRRKITILFRSLVTCALEITTESRRHGMV